MQLGVLRATLSAGPPRTVLGNTPAKKSRVENGGILDDGPTVCDTETSSCSDFPSDRPLPTLAASSLCKGFAARGRRPRHAMNSTTTTPAECFENGAALVWAYAGLLMLDGVERDIALAVAKNKMAYVPHIWNLGWIIPGFGRCYGRDSDWRCARA